MTSPTQPARRADRGVRVLSVETADEVWREVARTGAEEHGVRIMAPKGLHRLVRLEQVPTKAANIVKQEMLAAGGDAAVHRLTIACGVERTDIVLIGTESQLRHVCRKLRQDPFGLPGTADAVLQALRDYGNHSGVLRCGRHVLPLGAKTHIMGIMNITPDSFSGDGLAGNLDAALRQAEQMIADGADILDIGGESTRPGSEAVPAEEELRRVVPVVQALAGRFDVPISVDTNKSLVARESIAAGATIINDISGLRFDAEMARTVADASDVAVVVMHIKGTPRTMQQHPEYADLMTEVCGYLQASTALAMDAGIPRSQVILDPGFGFGKTVEHNLELLRRLRELRSYGQPVLLGASRKSTIGRVLGDLPPQERAEGTAATTVIGIMHGADIVRVHDVQVNARAARMADAVVRQ